MRVHNRAWYTNIFEYKTAAVHLLHLFLSTLLIKIVGSRCCIRQSYYFSSNERVHSSECIRLGTIRLWCDKRNDEAKHNDEPYHTPKNQPMLTCNDCVFPQCQTLLENHYKSSNTCVMDTRIECVVLLQYSNHSIIKLNVH